MSMGNTTENDLMLLFFNDTALSWDGNANLYIALHTADPGEAGSQTPPKTQGFVGYGYKELRKHSHKWRELKRKKKRDRRNDNLRILLLLESI